MIHTKEVFVTMVLKVHFVLKINSPPSWFVEYHHLFSVTMLREFLVKRKASSATHDDILDHLMRNEDGKHKLDDE